ncbi:quinol dehydrogenase ferredoxin subunit NapH [uncultured Campylobacter sp.]|jgi:ferredoxin-type protein, napH/mauN family|uniref:quinol dehydrogenase ferredoxin subunit NapH n=1 Tax=uncultured Campylobacter sp. TaxID=218934 RepID=UPI0025FB5BBC|nr:quinol dehydrogenase ferredoxin subunit NapH [uncultured Campylobacter sp.]
MKYLILRRISQILILALFAVSNFYGVKILQGNLSSSLLFGVVPLSDPFAVLQLFLASFSIASTALAGAGIVLIFYAFIAPRAFCSWVCPVNIITETARWFRVKLGFDKDGKIVNFSKNTRYYALGFVLILSLVTSAPAFEGVSYIGIIQRGVIYGGVLWLFVALGVFAIDAFLGDRIVCSKICPLGAFYAITSKFSLIRVEHNADNCTHCMKCKLICPENQVLGIIGKQNGFVASSECTSCGRCIDVCGDDALKFNIRNLRRKNESL